MYVLPRHTLNMYHIFADPEIFPTGGGGGVSERYFRLPGGP